MGACGRHRRAAGSDLLQQQRPEAAWRGVMLRQAGEQAAPSWQCVFPGSVARAVGLVSGEEWSLRRGRRAAWGARL